jgi:predicted lactoylglutathione lyase
MAQIPLANVFTLGVRNLANQREFYRRLGWPQIVDDDEFAAFELRGAVVGLFAVEKLAADGHADPELGRGGIRFAIGITVDSAAEVDKLAGVFRDSGGRVMKEPERAEFFEGRSCYVTDPEGNYFEIAWAEPDNPIVAAARRAAGLPAGV